MYVCVYIYSHVRPVRIEPPTNQIEKHIPIMQPCSAEPANPCRPALLAAFASGLLRAPQSSKASNPTEHDREPSTPEPSRSSAAIHRRDALTACAHPISSGAPIASAAILHRRRVNSAHDAPAPTPPTIVRPRPDTAHHRRPLQRSTPPARSRSVISEPTFSSISMSGGRAEKLEDTNPRK